MPRTGPTRSRFDVIHDGFPFQHRRVLLMHGGVRGGRSVKGDRVAPGGSSYRCCKFCSVVPNGAITRMVAWRGLLRVKTRVEGNSRCDDGGPGGMIRTTGIRAGRAMKVEDLSKALGAVIGKSDPGMIPILVALQ